MQTLQLENLFLDNVSGHEKQTFAARVNWGSSGSNYFIIHLVNGIYWANNLSYEGCRALQSEVEIMTTNIGSSFIVSKYFSIILFHLMSCASVPIL